MAAGCGPFSGEPGEIGVGVEVFGPGATDASLHAEEDATQISVIGVACVWEKAVVVGGVTQQVYALISSACG